MSTWGKNNLYDHIFDRWTEVDGDYMKANNNRDMITTYFRSDEIVDTDEKGNLVGQCIYSGGGPWYSRLMATGFQGSLVSKNIPWIRYQLQLKELKGIDQLDIWLQDVKDYMSDVYQRSNFYDVQPQFTHDGVTTGSPIIFGEENTDEERTFWMPQHYKNTRIYYDKYNRPEGVIVRDKTWTTKKIFDTFIGKDDKDHSKSKARLNTAVWHDLDQGRLGATHTVYRATFKVNDPIWDVQGVKTGQSTFNMGREPGGFERPNGDWTWLTAYFLDLTEAEAGKKNKPLNDNMGDFSQPFAIWNFDKKPWEATSRTPAFSALWDNLSLQQIDKNYLEDIQNQNRRAFIALDSMRNKVELDPEGEMYVTKDEYDSPPKFIDKVAGLQFSKDILEMKDDALKRWFYNDMFTMFAQVAQSGGSPPTATQIWQMAGEKATLLSPAIETHSSYLEAADARMIDIEQRARRGPFDLRTMENITDIILSNAKNPERVRSIGVQPVFIGALAQAQKTSQTLQPINATLEAIAPMIAVQPQLINKYDWYKLSGHVEDALDFEQDVIVPKDEYDKINAAQNEAAAKQQEFENSMEAMKNSKNIQGPVDNTSVLAGVTG